VNPQSRRPVSSLSPGKPADLSIKVNANGSIRLMDHRDILFLGTEIEGGPANLHLRRQGAIVEVPTLCYYAEGGGSGRTSTMPEKYFNRG